MYLYIPICLITYYKCYAVNDMHMSNECLYVCVYVYGHMIWLS